MWRAATVLIALSACADPTLEGTYAGDGGAPGMDYPAKWTLTIAKRTMVDGITAVEGSYTIQGIGLDTSGAISGTFNDPDLALTLTPANMNCGYTVMASWAGDEIDGTYAAVNCYVVAEGNLTLARK